jgi:hypothetical protein
MHEYAPNEPALGVDVPGCDARLKVGYYIGTVDGQPVFECRCVACPRCRRHAGMRTNDHDTDICRVLFDGVITAGATSLVEVARVASVRRHFCCPGDCELFLGLGRLVAT